MLQLFENDQLPTDPSLLGATAAQLMRDFERSGLALALREHDWATPDALLGAVAAGMQQLLGTQIEGLARAAYVVDVGQALLAQAFADPDPAMAVARVFLNRAAQKVLFRKMNSSENV